MQIYREKRFYLFVSILVLSLIAIYIHIAWRFSQVDAGICPKEGRVLSEKKLRQRMLENFVLIHVDFTDRYYKNLRSGSWRVGISPALSGADIKRLVRESFGNEKSFEENFSMEIIAPSEVAMPKEGYSGVDSLKEPFSLVFFTEDKSGLAKFISTKSVHEIEKDDDLREAYKTDLFDRYLGFGEHFYSVESLIIQKGCCDNRLYKRTTQEYMENKRAAYKGTFEAFDRGIAVHSRVVSVSTCGDVMTEKVENALSLDFVKWM